MSPSRDPAFRLDVAIIGAQKAATSTLFERLRQHPDVSGCRPKEPHHFVKNDWQETLPRYAGLFPRPGERLTLEASTTYSFAHKSDIVAERLHAHNPKLRVIYVVRERRDAVAAERWREVSETLARLQAQTALLSDLWETAEAERAAGEEAERLAKADPVPRRRFWRFLRRRRLSA